jgi:hypothetical protein
VNRALQVEDPKGRLDLLAVRLLEHMVKLRCNAPRDATVSVNLLDIGQMVCDHFGVKGFPELRPEVERIAREQGVSMEQTLPEIARNVGLLRDRRARATRRARCTR